MRSRLAPQIVLMVALFWHENLFVLLKITFMLVENFKKSNFLVKSTSNSAYKFFQ